MHPRGDLAAHLVAQASLAARAAPFHAGHGGSIPVARSNPEPQVSVRFPLTKGEDQEAVRSRRARRARSSSQVQTWLMASLIEAIIFDGGSLAAVPHGVKIVRLTSEWAMLPVTEELLEQLDMSAVGDDSIPPDWTLKQPVAALARSISIRGTALYLFSETFGGQGTTEAIAWTDGKLLYGPSGTCDIEADLQPGYHLAHDRDNAVNAGLRAIGVHANEGQDEYETMGLTTHRMTDDWLLG